MFLETKFSNEISNNWPNDLLETNVYKTPDFYWQILLKQYNVLIILQWFLNKESFWPFSFFVILLLVVSSNFIVSWVKNSR